MNSSINFKRRQLLKYAAFAVSGAASYPIWAQSAAAFKAVNVPSANFHPDVEIELTQAVSEVQIFGGPKTRVWKVQGKVLSGPSDAIHNHPDNYLAPTIRLKKGQKVRIYLNNDLPAHSILHWHGLHVPANMDGNPMYAVSHGEAYIYEFEIRNRAGTYWYHAHTHSVTARQVYSGLAGLFIVHDDEELALNLPSGEFDVPLVIQDRSFDKQNQLVYSDHMMQRMQGFLGDRIFVNGRPDFVLPVSGQAYRLRLLNGSNSRIYKLAWSDDSKMTVIGTDGGLLERPRHHSYVMLAPGERIELWVDFSGRPIGSEVTLRSLAFDMAIHGHGGMGMMGGGMGMMGGRGRGMMGGGMGMMHASALPSGSDYPLFGVKVVKPGQSSQRLPERLSTITKLNAGDAVNDGNPRTITLSMRHMSALLNGRSYKMNDVRSDEIIPLNSLQLIEFDNGYDGMHGMPMPHPMHLHGEQFQIVKRQVNPRSREAYGTVSAGLVWGGWKDTVMVMPGEKVTLLKPFNDFKGLFMYHCHNLEHEDMGMMRDFLVE